MKRKSDDQIVAEVLGVDVPRFVCGCERGFGMGFGYRDPLAICRSCRERRDAKSALTCFAVIVIGSVITWWFCR